MARTMHNFHQTAAKLLTEYRGLLRKQLSSEECSQELAIMKLDKRLPRGEKEIYLLLTEVVDKAEEQLASISATRYSGTERFVHHMKHVLACYRLEDDKVIHITQTASKAIIDAIQLMSLPEAELTEEVAETLTRHAALIAQYGVEEQKAIFVNAIKKHLSRKVDFFLPILNNFRNDHDELNIDWSDIDSEEKIAV